MILIVHPLCNRLHDEIDAVRLLNFASPGPYFHTLIEHLHHLTFFRLQDNLSYYTQAFREFRTVPLHRFGKLFTQRRDGQIPTAKGGMKFGMLHILCIR